MNVEVREGQFYAYTTWSGDLTGPRRGTSGIFTCEDILPRHNIQVCKKTFWSMLCAMFHGARITVEMQAVRRLDCRVCSRGPPSSWHGLFMGGFVGNTCLHPKISACPHKRRCTASHMLNAHIRSLVSFPGTDSSYSEIVPWDREQILCILMSPAQGGRHTCTHGHLDGLISVQHSIVLVTS